jgi:phosphoribosylanthranilate isomerase
LSKTARVRVKICGVTSVEDGLLAARLGADAIGLVFAPRSSRYLDIEQAREIAEQLPPLISRIALVMDAEKAFVDQLAHELPIDMLQFHGSENDAQCRNSGVPYLKAVSIDQTLDPGWQNEYPGACGFIIDSHAKGAAGGTGRSFDWGRFPDASETDDRPLILAGGLNIDNVAPAIIQCRPYAVDVSSGVESGPGKKDADLMNRFISEVNSVNHS